MKKVVSLSLITAVVLSMSSAYAAVEIYTNPQYGVPNGIPDPKVPGKYIRVGTTDGAAGLNVVDNRYTTSGYANNKLVSFAKMKKMASNVFVPKDFISPDTNGVYVARLYQMTGFPWSWIPGMPDHSHLGRLTFNQVNDTMDVWFGDWADVPSGAASGTAGTNYTVFFSGSNPTTNLPTSGSATYAVKGINNYVNRDTPLLTGTLTANFAASSLNGAMSRTGLTVEIKNAAIDAAKASFEGAAAANGVAGNTQGQFYGDQGAALAGVATFGAHSPLNTSFGGTKQ